MTQQSRGPGGPATAAARAAAHRLTDTYGPALIPDVEASLYATDSTQRPEQYLDPISLAALIVSAAQLAWTAYTDLKRKSPQPPAEVVERRVRVELPERTDISPGDRARIITVVTEEILRQAETSANQ